MRSSLPPEWTEGERRKRLAERARWYPDYRSTVREHECSGMLHLHSVSLSEAMQFADGNDYGDRDGFDPWIIGEGPLRLGATLGDCAERVLTGRPSDAMADYYRDAHKSAQGKARLKPIHSGESVRRRRRFRDEGDSLDIDRLLGGDPNHWIQMKRANRVQPSVTLFLNSTVTADLEAEAFARASAHAAVAAERLELRGLAVRILGGCISMMSNHAGQNGPVPAASGSGRTIVAHTIELKPAGRPLIPARIVAVGSPLVFRGFAFGHRINLGWRGPGGWPSYGNVPAARTLGIQAEVNAYTQGWEAIESEVLTAIGLHHSGSG